MSVITILHLEDSVLDADLIRSRRTSDCLHVEIHRVECRPGSSMRSKLAIPI